MERAIRGLFYFLLLTLPINMNPKLNDPYDFQKAITLYVINSIIGFIWLLQTIIKGTRLYKTGCNTIVFILLLVQLFSTVFSISPYISLWGHYLRYDGLLTWINYIFLFFVGICFINKPVFVSRAVTFICIGAAISGVVGICQYLSLGPQVWIDHEKSRVASTLGNPVFFAAYMVASLFPAMALFLYKEDRKFLFILGILIISIYLGLLFAQTRAAYIALFLCFGLFLMMQFIFLFSKESAKRLGILLVILVGLGLFLGMHPKTELFSRFGLTLKRSTATLISSKEAGQKTPNNRGVELTGTALERIYLWQQFFRMALDRPIFGTGPDTTILLFSYYRSPETTESIGQYGRADRAHNELIDTCATRGFVGVIVYLLTLIFLLRRFIINYKFQKYRFKILLIGIFMGALAYFIQNQFQLGTIPGMTLFWVLLSLGISTARYKYLYIEPTKIKSLGILIVAIISLLIFLYLHVLYRHYKADIYFRIANICEKEQKHWDYAIVWYNRALNLWKKQDKYYESLINLYLKKALIVEGERRAYLADKGRELAEFAVKELPTCSILWNLLGAAYQIRGLPNEAIKAFKKAHQLDPYFIDPINNIAMVYLELKDYKKAEDILKRGLKIYKDCPRYMHSMGLIYKKQGKLAQAEEILRKVLSIDPDYDRKDQVHMLLADIYEEEKKYKLAIEEYNNIQVKDYATYSSIGSLYFKMGELDKALEAYKKAISLNPDNIVLHRDIGSIYFKKGDFVKAKEEFLYVLSRDPTDKYVLSLLKQINL